VRPLPAAVFLATLASALGAACHVPDSRAWNLNQIHDESTHHRYTGAIESDTEYFFRHEIAGAFASTGANFEAKAAVAVPDPATTCLENLIALEGYGQHDPRIAGIQIEWASRLAAADPWRLTRERAMAILGQAGKRITAGVPAGLPEGSIASGPDAVSEALAGLLRASRPVLDHGSRLTDTERLDLDSACEVIRGLTLDLDGARRLLHASVDLSAAAGWGKKSAAPLADLALELERRCVRFGLAAGLKDTEPIVRAAAVEASVRCAGPSVLDPILLQLQREPTPEVILRVMDLIRELGLPTTPIATQPVAPNAETTLTPEQSRKARLAAIFDLLDRPEGSVRVSAMRTLSAVSGAGVHSLREEDWQGWWVANMEKRNP
jgi:hypothetical protein